MIRMGNYEPGQASGSGSDAGPSIPSNEGDIRALFDAAKGMLSSKLKQVLDTVKAVHQDDNAAKFLLFSAFDGTRKRLEKELKASGKTCTNLVSSMSPGTQAAHLQKFNMEPDNTVLLLSTQVANVGLNLTSANHIFFIDQPLSLTQAKQAVGRCHRIGQGRPVRVWSFDVADTIEATIAKAAKTQLEEAEAPGNADADGNHDRRARGRNLLGKEELLEHFKLTQQDIYEP